jgi:hypothetical protein
LIDPRTVGARAKAWKVVDARAAIKGHVNPVVRDMAKVEARAKVKIVQDKVRYHFSTLDVVKILEIKREALREWIDRGFIIPSTTEKISIGIKSLFNMRDLYKIQIFKELIGIGFSRKLAAKKINNILNSNGKINIDLGDISKKVDLMLFVKGF